MATFAREPAERFELDPAHDIRNVHGAPGWIELSTPDPAGARDFVEAVFGWGFQTMQIGGADYTVVEVRGHGVGGIRAPQPGEGPGPAWSTYVTVADADDTARRVEEAGGTVLVPPTELPDVGRLVAFEHPAAGRMLAFEYLRPFD
jgi:predicted enzyme related to lactoylglutathione lyase